ncbi:leucine-rich repeat-containing protein 25 [Onychomys torridus]|uniref:leucine-rich repeat-containing protein 25 n=1 Tax=Onychomys torridus TaxID=38674 RepID=UPI00167F40EB|nr:leucine-rich repeat-containing protein 25 [Onychomys torridus]
MGATRARLLWTCLLLLLALPRESGSQDLTCMVSSSHVNWTQTFSDTCLNFSGLGLSLPRTQSLKASRVQVLDLSRNKLQALPGLFFANLEKLQTLIVTHNQLVSVDQSLALRCDLELRADCSCGLASWYDIRQNNCSGEQGLLCLHSGTGAPRNLSTFLQVSCRTSLAPWTVGALVAGVIFLALAVSGSLLAWRLWGHRGASGLGLSKAQCSHASPRPVTGFLPRHSSQRRSPKAPVTPPDRSTLDYENVFIGQPAEDCSWPAPRSPSGDTDFYMNYKGDDWDPQPIYCNLESLGRAPGYNQEYVAPGR